MEHSSLKEHFKAPRPFNTQISNISISLELEAKEKGLTKAAIAIVVEVDGPSPSHFIVKARSDGQHNVEEEASSIS